VCVVLVIGGFVDFVYEAGGEPMQFCVNGVNGGVLGDETDGMDSDTRIVGGRHVSTTRTPFLLILLLR